MPAAMAPGRANGLCSSRRGWGACYVKPPPVTSSPSSVRPLTILYIVDGLRPPLPFMYALRRDRNPCAQNRNKAPKKEKEAGLSFASSSFALRTSRSHLPMLIALTLSSLLGAPTSNHAVLHPHVRATDAEENTTCATGVSMVITLFNEKYEHILANFVAHMHHQDCQVPTRLHATDNSSFALCERLLLPTDNAKCVLTDCESVVQGQSCDEREAISFLKFYLLRQTLAEMQNGAQESVLYLDATAMVQGKSCLSELGSMDADVAASPELMLPGCPEEKLAPEVMWGNMATGLNANTGVLFWRPTEPAKAFLDALIAEYEAHIGDETAEIRANYSACPEQAHFNLYSRVSVSVGVSVRVSATSTHQARHPHLDTLKPARAPASGMSRYVKEHSTHDSVATSNPNPPPNPPPDPDPNPGI